MARPGITYDEVVAAIDSIIANGEEPTINRIREHLGTGSPNTIHRHLTAWRSSQPTVQRIAPELPPELQAAIVKELERQAADARSEIEKMLVAAQNEAATLSKSGEEIEEANADIEDENAKLASQNERLEALAKERHDENEYLKIELDRERKAAEEARIQVAQGRHKIESLEKDAAELKDQIKAVSSDLKAAEKGRIDAEKATAVLEAKLESEIKTTTELRTQLETVTQRHDDLYTEIRSLQNEKYLLSEQSGSFRGSCG